MLEPVVLGAESLDGVGLLLEGLGVPGLPLVLGALQGKWIIEY